MNPLILLFNENLFLLTTYFFYLDMGVRRGDFVSGYSGSCICVYSIQRYVEKGLASEIFLGVSRSFYMAMFYLYD